MCVIWALWLRESTEILGLQLRHRDDNMAWLSSNGRRAELVLHKSDENGVRSLGFEALSREAAAEAMSRVDSAGCQLLSDQASLDCCSYGFQFTTPQGHFIEVHSPVNEDITRNSEVSIGMSPKRLDHVNMTSPEPAETRKQFEHIMGLRLSERMVDDGLSWMRGANGQHHCLGIVRGPTGFITILSKFMNLVTIVILRIGWILLEKTLFGVQAGTVLVTTPTVIILMLVVLWLSVPGLCLS